jgi:hypothetical protein
VVGLALLAGFAIATWEDLASLLMPPRSR